LFLQCRCIILATWASTNDNLTGTRLCRRLHNNGAWRGLSVPVKGDTLLYHSRGALSPMCCCTMSGAASYALFQGCLCTIANW
jgi:hypothetical protein